MSEAESFIQSTKKEYKYLTPATRALNIELERNEKNAHDLLEQLECKKHYNFKVYHNNNYA